MISQVQSGLNPITYTLEPCACSLDKVKAWSGDITTKDGLIAAVEARGFVHGAGERPELILVLGGSRDLPAALNLHLGFRKVLELWCQGLFGRRVEGVVPEKGI